MDSEIRYKMLPDGGFVAGDPVTRITCYAYPASQFAEDARRKPVETAQKMIDREWNGARERGFSFVTDYDLRNWERLK